MNHILDESKNVITDSNDISANKNNITNKIKNNHIRYVNIITIICVLIWLFLSVVVYKLLINTRNIHGLYFIVLCIIPIPCILYHRNIIKQIISNSDTIIKEKKRIISKLKMETEFC